MFNRKIFLKLELHKVYLHLYMLLVVDLTLIIKISLLKVLMKLV